MDKKLRFSVIIPVHNKLPHLERSINSVLNQTYPEFELIIVNDASTDGSAEKLQEFSDDRIRLFDRPEPGPGGYLARNMGIDKACSDWICFLDADDEWAPELLDTLYNAIIQNPQATSLSWGYYHVTGGTKKLDRTSSLNKKDDFRRFELVDLFRQRHTLWTGAVAFRKDILLRAGKFPAAGYKRGGDVDTWIRCLALSKENIWINKPLSNYYLDSVNMVTKSVKRESGYIFSPFVMDLLKRSDDYELRKAIKEFQNQRIYSILRGQMIDGQRPDFRLISKMNVSSSGMLLLAKLMARKLMRT
ncbi:glycosyltransferase family 2 protein [Arcticibacter sp.]|uniref:glycosyltransferase family 2 protein n=1 Tax=Arcticibacter sp. TaxID=1872630 RepID=UPI00388E557F